MADYPLTAQAGAEIFTDYDRHFEEGLALVIGGSGPPTASTEPYRPPSPAAPPGSGAPPG